MRNLFLAPVYSLFFLCLTFGNANAQQVFKTTLPSTIAYLEYVPQGYESNSDKYPVMIFLHGIGERGPNSTDPAVLGQYINLVAKLGPPMYVKNGTQFPFILISPQLKNNYGTWPSSYVMEVINHVKNTLRIDEKRIFLTGLSLGGGGVWMTAQDYPELFAAIAPVCGGYNTPSKACNIASENLPVWAFHGDADTTVPLSRTVNMVNAINACTPAPSPLAKVTIYHNVAHNAWTNAYKIDNSIHNPNLYQWMMSFTNTINKGSKIPTASAGSDRTVCATSTSLTGTGTDADGSIASYAWTQIAGPSKATLNNNLTATANVSNLVSGDYIFKLTVKDNSGNTDSDYIRIVSDKAPVANAGADKTITLPTNSITISGSGTDSDGTITGYAWTKISGSTSVLAGTTTPNLNVSSLIAGVYVFRLTVTDNKGVKRYDDMTLTVVGSSNILPVANAGADKAITLPANSVVLNGTGTDSDGTIASYAWSKVSGSTAVLSGTTTSSLTASSLVAGTYVYRLTVKDDKGGAKSDDVTVTVLNANSLPLVNAGVDKGITLPTNSIVLVGSASDADGTITSHLWTKVSGGTAVLAGATTATLTASSLGEGTYVFRLTATDDKGASKYDDVKVTVFAAVSSTTLNKLPVSNAGADKTITLPTNSINITGSGTDPDGTITYYHWSRVSGPYSYIYAVSKPTVQISQMTAGTYVFRLTVTDNAGATASDDITVVVKEAITSTASFASEPMLVLEETSGNLPSDDSPMLGNITRAELKNSTVVIFNDAGEKVYSGGWDHNTYKEVFQQKGMYIYNVIREGRRMNSGKIVIRD